MKISITPPYAVAYLLIYMIVGVLLCVCDSLPIRFALFALLVLGQTIYFYCLLSIVMNFIERARRSCSVKNEGDYYEEKVREDQLDAFWRDDHTADAMKKERRECDKSK